MTIYSLETHAGIWHANFLSVAHLHWKKGKRWEAFWSLLKTELRGMNSYHWAQGIIDFLHNGSQVLHLTPWVVGWKCIPRCSYYLKYLPSRPLSPGEGGGGVRSTQFSEWAARCTCSLPSPLRELGLGFLIFSGQKPKAPLFRPGSQGEGRTQGKPAMKYILIL